MIKELDKAVMVLRFGGTILYPTDTVWGIGCDATNREPVEKISTLKKRGKYKSFIILVDSREMLMKYVKEIPEQVRNIINVKTPLTIIYPDVTGIASNIAAKDGSVGIRITRDKFCRKLIGILGKPIVSTSANISREAVPDSFSEIAEPILNGVDHIVNLRRNEKTSSQLSNIIKFSTSSKFEVIRK